MRERRGSYSGCVVGCIPSFCWIIKMKDLTISLVDVDTLGEPRISVSLLYCVSFVFYFHIYFILSLNDPVFLTTGIRAKGTHRKRGFLVQVGAMAEDGKFRVEKFNGQNY
jgi:hypothetical protein